MAKNKINVVENRDDGSVDLDQIKRDIAERQKREKREQALSTMPNGWAGALELLVIISILTMAVVLYLRVEDPITLLMTIPAVYWALDKLAGRFIR